MGIKNLLKFISKACRNGHIENFKGKTVAVDTSCIIHKSFYTLQSYILLIKKYIKLLLKYECKVILVFDGKPWHTKSEVNIDRSNLREKYRTQGELLLKKGKTAEALKYLKRCAIITPFIVDRIISSVKNIDGVTIIKSPYESDAQLAYLTKMKLADIIITEDSDLIVYGAEHILYKLKLDGSCIIYEKSELSKSIADIKFEDFRLLCILAGCDYLPGGLRGIGLKNGLLLLKKISRPFKEIIPTLPGVTEDFLQKLDQAEKSFLLQTIYDPITNTIIPLNNEMKNEE